MATFYNQATLSYGNIVKNSNITEGEIVSGAALTKTALTSDYGPGDSISYAVTLTNSNTTGDISVTLTDNLGAYIPAGGTAEVVPLSYVEGSLLYYRNGTLSPAPTVTAADTLVISGISVPAGGNVLLIYETRANEFAPLDEGASITNSISSIGACEDIVASATVNTRNEFILSIAKAISPATVVCNGEITYTFIVQNYGNTDAVATDGITVSDNFAPALSDISVTLNGAPLDAGVGYAYDEATGEFSTTNGAIAIPAATFTRDPVTEIVTATPGVAVITVTGNI